LSNPGELALGAPYRLQEFDLIGPDGRRVKRRNFNDRPTDESVLQFGGIGNAFCADVTGSGWNRAHADCGSHADGHADCGSHADGHADCGSHADGHADCGSHADGHTDCGSHADGHTDCGSHADGHTDCDAGNLLGAARYLLEEQGLLFEHLLRAAAE
jgi:hypothetical protein